MSYSTPEGRITKKILDYLNGRERTTAHKVHGSQYSTGEPDIDAVSRGRAVKLEVKVPGTEASIRKRTTPLQRLRLRQYLDAGAIAAVVTSVEEVQAIIDGHPLDVDADGDQARVIARVKARLE